MESVPFWENKLYCLIAGSRGFCDYELLKNKMDEIFSRYPSDKKKVIVSGGAKGADSLAERYAKEKGYELVVMKADWDKYGKSAGYRRNEQMHLYIKDHTEGLLSHRMCVCFWDGQSKGTQHNFALAKKYHTNLVIVKTA